MAELLVEFLCEEIPARMQEKATKDLAALFAEQLNARGLKFSSYKTYVTPRRLTIVLRDVPVRQGEVREEKRGPRVDAPSVAIEGFLQGLNITLADCEARETPKGTFLFVTISKPPQETVTLLPEIVSAVIDQFPWQKSMKWGLGGQTTWVRPCHSILCLFDHLPIDLQLRIPSLPHTTGHRFMSPSPVMVASETSYVENLQNAYVIVDAEARKQAIAQSIDVHLSQYGLALRQDLRLLDEVAGLVEWPHLILGNIDPLYMDLPEEILTTVMRNHQRYFTIENAQQKLAPFFLTIANIIPEDGGALIIRGNEHVLKARLSDAKFFWEDDQRKRLEQHAQGLDRLIFHAKLGTIADKMQRIEVLAEQLNQLMQMSLNSERIYLAARVIKADLTTQTVREFPELQGVIGFYLALKEGLGEDIALAIRGHYAPQGQDKAVAATPLAILMGLADKLDTLAGFFMIHEKPTGSKDPYALRRAALGIIRTVLENNLQAFDVDKILGIALLNYACPPGVSREDIAFELKVFMMERLRVYFKDKGYRHDIIEAAMAEESNIVVMIRKIESLQAFMQQEEALALTRSYKRASNILRQSGFVALTEIPLAKEEFVVPEEISLYVEIQSLAPRIETIISQKQQIDFASVFAELTNIAPTLDAFFEHVTVNAEDPHLRQMRLSLLAQVQDLFEQVLDFGKLEG
ncbi:MAG: glycine--tRNA ligase subunit beta [Alphaproteobacteria bacterium]|nr:glycine--tRNA ligase subunit beta [Alphaproteobacteria bacterium]OJV45693.1 MAG: glycine--tRNA ligase subunit beta [Alphaproteobacteria bacterium 43-37]